MVQTRYDFAFQRWVDRTYARLVRPLDFRARTVEEWCMWRTQLRAKIWELSGMLPRPEPCDLAAEVVERTELHEEGLVREKVVYQSEPEVWVPAYLLRPLTAPVERLPAVMALHGHAQGGRWGKAPIAGAAELHPQVRQNIEGFNYDYGHQLARRGYVVLCPDARAWGERAVGWWEPGEPVRGADPCDRAGNKAALLGYSLLALTIWDDRRGIDYLQSRPDVAPGRIGAVGLSYGGTQALYLAALDERVRATVISGFFSTFQHYALGQTFCAAQFVPGLLRWAELPDVTALIAPRALLIEAGWDDESYPAAVSRQAHETLERVYRLLGAEDCLWRDDFEGGHRWHGDVAYPFLERYLGRCSPIRAEGCVRGDLLAKPDDPVAGSA